jgi:hypothetical protein
MSRVRMASALMIAVALVAAGLLIDVSPAPSIAAVLYVDGSN